MVGAGMLISTITIRLRNAAAKKPHRDLNDAVRLRERGGLCLGVARHREKVPGHGAKLRSGESLLDPLLEQFDRGDDLVCVEREKHRHERLNTTPPRPGDRRRTGSVQACP